MKFRITVKNETPTEPWTEDEDRPEIKNMEEAQEWAKNTIAKFNNTLRPYETARTLIKVEDLPEDTSEEGRPKRIEILFEGRVIIEVDNDFSFSSDVVQEELVYQVSMEDAEEWEVEATSVTLVED